MKKISSFNWSRNQRRKWHQNFGMMDFGKEGHNVMDATPGRLE
jgi:hypothetical protein